MAWKIEDLFKALGSGIESATATSGRLLIDVAWAIVPPLPRLCRRDSRPFVEAQYSPLVLRLLLYAVLFMAVLLYYGRR